MKSPIIIVEGIDRTGKTTFCNKLSKKTGFPIFKHIRNILDYSEMDNNNETDKFLQLIRLHSMTNGDGVIFDRCYISDYVYGIIERDYASYYAYLNKCVIEQELNKMNCILVLMLPTDIKRSSKEHGKDLTEYEEYFESAFYHSFIKHRIECNYDNIDDCINGIVEYVKE